MSTPAIQFLTRKSVSFEIVKYRHDEKGAQFAAIATGFPLVQTVKTLVVNLDGNHFTLALVSGDKQLSMKRLAKVRSVKRPAMADTRTAERITGYLAGGISPFGTRQNLAAIIDEGILKFDQVLINAGQRGMMLKMSPEDIRKTLNATVAVVSHSGQR
jgi:Cys-tRNA(Pro)/Cys-tRNA(Cys) deacylase